MTILGALEHLPLVGTVYISGANVYKTIRRESNLRPDFCFADEGIAGGERVSAVAPDLKRQLGVIRLRLH